MGDILFMVSPFIGFLLITPLLDAIQGKKTGELKIPWRFGELYVLKRVDDPSQFERQIKFLFLFPIIFLIILIGIVALNWTY